MCYWSIVGRVVGISFVGFIDEYSGAYAPFLGSVVVFGNNLEEMKDKVVCGVREEFNNLVRHTIRSWGFA